MQGSETVRVHPQSATDWQGDPTGAPGSTRDVPSVVLIPRTQGEGDDRIVVDSYQVVMTDTTFEPPAAEDSISIPSTPGEDPDRRWSIDGGVGPYRKPSGDLKAYIFVIKRVR